MRTKILVLGVVFLLIIPVLAQEEKEVINSFESVISRIDKFFSASPIVLASEISLGSKVLEDDGAWRGRRTREAITVYYLLKFEKQEIGYDIQKTTSIITPYIGYIVIPLWVKSNASYGNVNDGKYYWGFQSAEDAEKVKKFARCAQDPNAPESYWCFGDIKLTYSYQRKKWIFKEVDTETSDKIRKTKIREVLKETILKNPEWKKVIN